ncbi:hypothetical protein Tco_1145145 [Tanacetum coccineum]
MDVICYVTFKQLERARVSFSSVGSIPAHAAIRGSILEANDWLMMRVAVAVALVGWQRRRKQGSRGDDVGWRCVVAVALGMVVTSDGDGVDGGYIDGAVAGLRWWGDHDGGGDVRMMMTMWR